MVRRAGVASAAAEANLRLKRPPRVAVLHTTNGGDGPGSPPHAREHHHTCADDPHMTSARSRKGAVGAAAEANLEGKTAVAATVLRTINVGDGPVSMPHARDNCHI